MKPEFSGDRYYRRAMREGYRSRAVYKIAEIENRFRIIRPDDTVVDLGAAPGSWLQEIRTMTAGKVIGIDLNPIAPIEGVTTIVGDFTDPQIVEQVRAVSGVVNVVVSDASPKLSGQSSYDQARAIALGEEALAFAVKVLKRGGNFLVKSFQGELFNDLLNEVRKHFFSVRVYRTTASRRGSAEVYIVAKNYRPGVDSQGDDSGSVESDGPGS
jgi:23S rRNA (uridine2552-2'-O)-methyltransferase